MTMAALTPETQLRDYLCMHGIPFEHDSRISMGLSLSRYRPDFLIRHLGISVIVEIDQDGHREYPRDEEASRMMELWSIFNGAVVFLRVFIPEQEVFTETALSLIYRNIEFCATQVRCNTTDVFAVYLFYPEDLITQITKEMPKLIMVALPSSKSISGIERQEISTPKVVEVVCERCGERFANKANLLRHLRKTTACPEVNSTMDRELIINALFKAERKTFPCGYCQKFFKHASSACKHRKTCEAYQKDRASQTTPPRILAQVGDMRKEIKRLSDNMAKLMRSSEEEIKE